jgi:putative methionine-R-sulfoxide reductase with GAF domain
MFPSDVSKTNLDPRRHAALLGMADIVCLRQDPGELFRKLVPHLQSVFSFDLLTFAVSDSPQRVMKMYVWEGSQWLRGPLEVPVENSVVGSVWRNQSAASIDDLMTEKQFDPELQWLREQEIQSYSVLPLTNFHEKLGAIGFGSRQTHAFDRQDLYFLARVAEMVALCVDTTLPDATLAEEVSRRFGLATVGCFHPPIHSEVGSSRLRRRLSLRRNISIFALAHGRRGNVVEVGTPRADSHRRNIGRANFSQPPERGSRLFQPRGAAF